jgi:hypothetical protein
MKQKLLINALALMVLLLVMSPMASAQLGSYQGCLSTDDGGIVATGAWDYYGLKLCWDIQEQADNSWFYQYWFSLPDGSPIQYGNPSHFIMSVSPDVTERDFWGFNGSLTELRVGDDNPFDDAPGLFPALKLDYEQTYYSFYSWRVPTLQDFYTKDGTAGGYGANTAWNSGYGDALPAGFSLADYAQYGKILAPDTGTTVVPEPGTMLLFGLGLVGAGVVRKIRK